ncbi:MAG: thiol:disulfide interchange protein DsbA/DsbL [Sutterellaceae bacterium]|nr:thiol:disulfide interchange protein DsbA/DsbL [Sutterellaceae bacterium]
MFKKSLLAVGLSLFALTATAAAVEGTDYVKLEKPLVNAEGKLTKIFSYDCPFCFKYDVGVDPKVLPRVEKELGLAFNPQHLETKGKYGRAGSEFLAMCMIKDKAAGVSIEAPESLFKKAKDAIYQAYHKKGERWTSGEAAFVKTMTDATGISVDEFNKAKEDPAVKALCDEWKASYDAAKIQGIPAYVVNGKYLIMTKSIRNFDGMVNLVKELKDMK